ncbi:MAG: hypothetical protein INR71_04150, partial [Terriglobus roseus]|nr:hypothetical protein [Terriglobus roseus]
MRWRQGLCVITAAAPESSAPSIHYFAVFTCWIIPSPAAMAAEPGAVVDEVERYRLELEANVNKLRHSLQHWQKWEIDYGEFSEKLEDVDTEPSLDSLRAIRDSIDASLISDKEMQELLGSETNMTRDRSQVMGVLARRIEYVQQNARALQKQLDLAEHELTRAEGGQADDVDDAFADEQGLPITEILEELDEHGNVVASSTSTAKDMASSAAGVLGQAGIKDWIDADAAAYGKPDRSSLGADEEKAKLTPSPPSTSLTPHGTADKTQSARKKSVSFAPDVSIAPSGNRSPSPPPPRASSPPLTQLPPTPIKSKPSVPWEVAESRRGRFHTGTRVIELDENDAEIGSLPVVPLDDESPEDAALRREMTQYALGEVGAIVAEMDLDDGDLDVDAEDDDGLQPSDDDGDDDGEAENEFGM